MWDVQESKRQEVSGSCSSPQSFRGKVTLDKRNGIFYNGQRKVSEITEEEKRISQMRFRPCIDIHNGKVKQIVGGSLKDEGDQAKENFVSEQDAAFFAEKYRKDGVLGGHVILLNAIDSPWYQKTKEQAKLALQTYPGGLQVGGGITDENAKEFLAAGASHVIVTSFVFRDGRFQEENLKKLLKKIGKKHLVLDLSCRQKEGDYYIVTDRWQKFTSVRLDVSVLDKLAGYCDEFLIHAVDVEGKASGIETELVKMLGNWKQLPVTYAGGVGSFRDLMKLKELGQNQVDVTIGSALDLFGGMMEYEKVLQICRHSAADSDTCRMTGSVLNI